VTELGDQPIDQERDFHVSLVIPVRDESQTLPELFESIAAQSFPPTEVVFVDAGSVDNTTELIKTAARVDTRFRLIEAGPSSPGRARNVGIKAAINEWIALTDAGMRLESTWLERLVKVARESRSTDVVFGNYEPLVDSFFERCAALAYVSPKQMRNGHLMRGPAVPSSLLRFEVWRTVGGFPDSRAAEDLMFIEAIAAKGYHVEYSPTATTWWRLRPTLSTTFDKFVTYSRYNVWMGRQWDWHYGVRRIYLLLIPFLVLAIVHSIWWMLGPVLLHCARTFKRIWNNRERRGLLWAINPAQFVGVGLLILVIDAATFIGWAQALARQPGSRPAIEL
jgi:glycosyltransferase involved in cell wall biosynthesis